MRYVLGVIGVILVALLAIFLINSRPSSNNTNKNTQTKEPLKLIDYSTRNSEVAQTTQGRIVGEDQFTSIRITITPSNRTIDILKGYEGNVERSESFTNTSAAYDNFLHALSIAGFNKTKTAAYADERGVCSLGNRYIYNLKDNGSQVIRTWSASCGDVGSFAGSGSGVRQLFQNQIPDYSKFVVGVQL